MWNKTIPNHMIKHRKWDQGERRERQNEKNRKTESKGERGRENGRSKI